jgi:hypothetical protein
MIQLQGMQNCGLWRYRRHNMANIAIFKTNQTPEYLESVNTPDYENDPDVLIDPDVSQVQNIERRFWKRDNNNIIEMTASEKQAVLDAELNERKLTVDEFGFQEMKVVLKSLIKVLNLRLKNGEKITQQELIQAIKDEIK